MYVSWIDRQFQKHHAALTVRHFGHLGSYWRLYPKLLTVFLRSTGFRNVGCVGSICCGLGCVGSTNMDPCPSLGEAPRKQNLRRSSQTLSRYSYLITMQRCLYFCVTTAETDNKSPRATTFLLLIEASPSITLRKEKRTPTRDAI